MGNLLQKKMASPKSQGKGKRDKVYKKKCHIYCCLRKPKNLLLKESCYVPASEPGNLVWKYQDQFIGGKPKPELVFIPPNNTFSSYESSMTDGIISLEEIKMV